MGKWYEQMEKEHSDRLLPDLAEVVLSGSPLDNSHLDIFKHITMEDQAPYGNNKPEEAKIEITEIKSNKPNISLIDLLTPLQMEIHYRLYEIEGLILKSVEAKNSPNP